jgi:hypothetical protein
MRFPLRAILPFLLIAVGASAQDVPETTAKAPVPDAEAIKKAETELKELLKAEFKSTDAADRRALAKKLLEAGGKTESDAATRYVVLREAADVAAQAEDLGTSFGAVDRLAAQFEVDPFALKADALTTARKAARRTDVLAKIAVAALKTAREARGADRLEPAVRALKEAENAAKGAKDATLSKSIADETKLVAAAKKDLADVEEARAKLAGAPDDTKANLTLGRWLVFEKGKPKEGLPYLAKGADKRLAEAAKLDLEGFDALRIGEAWMKLAADPRLPRPVLLARGCEWLRKAWESEDPLGRERLRARIFALLASPKPGKLQADTAPPSWTIMGDQSKVSWDPTLSWTGDRSVKLMPAGNRAVSPRSWTGFYQKLSTPIVAGAEYRISVRALTDKAGNGNGVWLIFWGADGKPVKETSVYFAPDLPVWTLVELKLEAPAGAEKIEVSFHQDTTTGAVWIDAASLTCQGEELLPNGDLEPK